ncbi:hypothetical protein B0H13DRAFT_1896448 [Mycena leptocephala]|nr:hypothetical protein B0H13DRAFT_1896448 [Mycena leptocephala]
MNRGSWTQRVWICNSHTGEGQELREHQPQKFGTSARASAATVPPLVDNSHTGEGQEHREHQLQKFGTSARASAATVPPLVDNSHAGEGQEFREHQPRGNVAHRRRSSRARGHRGGEVGTSGASRRGIWHERDSVLVSAKTPPVANLIEPSRRRVVGAAAQGYTHGVGSSSAVSRASAGADVCVMERRRVWRGASAVAGEARLAADGQHRPVDPWTSWVSVPGRHEGLGHMAPGLGSSALRGRREMAWRAGRAADGALVVQRPHVRQNDQSSRRCVVHRYPGRYCGSQCRWAAVLRVLQS